MASFPGQKSTGPPLPNPITGLVASVVSAAQVNVSWTAVSNATSYNVLRGGVLISSPVSPSVSDTTVSANTTYLYTVQGVNSNGMGASAPVSATTPPAQVTGLVATALSSSSIGLGWDATPGASTYTVDRGGSPIGTVGANSFTDTGLAPSTLYSYTVAANGAGGQGAASAPASATTQASSHAIKFNPGDYGASRVRTDATNSALAQKQSEIALVLASGPNVHGWLGRYQWPAIQSNSASAYNFAYIDTDYTQLTGITKAGDTPTGKRMIIQFMVDNFGHTPGAVVPAFILNNPTTFGAGNITGGTGGYWGYGTSLNTVVAAVWRPSVAGAMNAMIAALGAHVLPSGFTVDQDPYIEAFMSWELSSPVGASGGGSDYSASAFYTQTTGSIAASVTAFPHTLRIFENNFVDNQAQSVQIQDYLHTHACGFGGPDILGYTFYTGTGHPVGNLEHLTWGQQVFIGAVTTDFPSGNPDLRGKMPCVHEIEDAELAGFQFGPYTPQDIADTTSKILSLPNNSGGVSHRLWDIITPGSAPAVMDPTTKLNTGANPGNWPSVLSMINANPVPYTGYPSNLP